VSDETLECLESYSWPGNVRELRHAIERVVLLEDCDVILPAHLSQKLRGSSSLSRARGLMTRTARLSEVEREHIYRVLEETEGNRTRAAEILGITRQTLINKLKMYGHPVAADSDKAESDARSS
jgi:DNA-binding NtrC family response regulator